MKYLKLSAVILVLTAGNAWAQATRTTTINQIPFDVIDGNPCTGEGIQYSGFLDEVQVEMFDSAGGLHLSYSLMLRQADAIGLSTGINYNVLSRTQTTINAPGNNGPFTLTSLFKIVAPGSGLSFSATALFHTTVNANGVLTAVVDSFSAVCR